MLLDGESFVFLAWWPISSFTGKIHCNFHLVWYLGANQKQSEDETSWLLWADDPKTVTSLDIFQPFVDLTFAPILGFNPDLLFKKRVSIPPMIHGQCPCTSLDSLARMLTEKSGIYTHDEVSRGLPKRIKSRHFTSE